MLQGVATSTPPGSVCRLHGQNSHRLRPDPESLHLQQQPLPRAFEAGGRMNQDVVTVAAPLKKCRKAHRLQTNPGCPRNRQAAATAPLPGMRRQETPQSNHVSCGRPRLSKPAKFALWRR
ncbi:unnamed protein product [Pleuronectes platessa]|uniref:Uncharacterized protein n=1 Tax=Pleuronectes platessa TaxID=8262 RepID=A0A9N7TTY2_PLEPL|nr:unnamed protein product [Pleuronectes platessa]